MSERDHGLGAMYGVGARELQDEFDSRRLADRLIEVTLHTELDQGDIDLVGDQAAVWVATVDADGWPDLSYKGGNPGFVRVVSPTELHLPIYNGNGMWRTLGNIRDNGRVALLFVDQHRPWRMRVHGTGTVLTDASVTDTFIEAEAVVVIAVGRVFPNCGRYIHRNDEISPYVPQPDRPTPIPDWKRLPVLRDVLPASDAARLDEPG
ncbi:MAG: pyridoxamine 5'-phosphate oxidase family protein [Acidimicrobiales bacterium]